MKFLSKLFGKSEPAEPAVEAPPAEAAAVADASPVEAEDVPAEDPIREDDGPTEEAPAEVVRFEEAGPAEVVSFEEAAVAASSDEALASVEPTFSPESDVAGTGVDLEASRRLAQARNARDEGQPREAVPHYQAYLRSAMDADVFEELAEVYSTLDDSYMASSARGIAQSIRSKGG